MTAQDQFTTPQSTQAEQSVIGALLLRNDSFDRMGDLRAEHFYNSRHREIFAVISGMILKNVPADVVTVFEALQAKGGDTVDLPYLHEMAQNTPSAANIQRYAAIVREKAQRRGLLEVASDAEAAVLSSAEDAATLIDGVQAKLEKLSEARIKSDPVRVSDDMPSYLDDLSERAEGGGSPAISTGFPDLDRRINGGIHAGHLVVIAGRPKMGKTALAMNIGLHAAMMGKKVLTLSMEMPRRELHDRNVAVLGRVKLERLVSPSQMDNNDWRGVTIAVSKLEGLDMFIDDRGGLRLPEVRQKVRTIKRKYGLDLVIIDYLQLMDGEGDNRNSQIETITRGLKSLAKELGVGIVLLSQLNRKLEERQNKRPLPSDLRDSGSIEQDCDVALFLYRDEVYNPNTNDVGVCEVNVGLIRQGKPGTVGLVYIGEQTRFESMASGSSFGREPSPAPTRRKGFEE